MNNIFKILLLSSVMLLANAFNNNLQPLTTLYNFSDGVNLGNYRSATLTKMGNDGFLYGTTVYGSNSLSFCTYGCGTIFKINPTTGVLTTLYNFSGTDGAFPDSSLTTIDNDGFLYGTTLSNENNQCDGYGCGTIFKFNPTTGKFTTLYEFSGKDGKRPDASLITVDNDGFLYGTTDDGGINGYGTIFKLNLKTNILTTLHQFSYKDGAFIQSSLTTIGNDGFLYGTTSSGGNHEFGTIFKLNKTTGVLTTLYNFSGTDGAMPFSSLTTIGNDGFLYGTTSRGGNHECGTIFKLNPTTGSFTTLYSFSGTDGAYPSASLSTMGNDGFLYGTTRGGGNNGLGTIFKLNPTTGFLTILYKFSGTDGSNPFASLTTIGNDGFLYGISSTGGSNDVGTIFKINPNIINK